MLAVGLRCLHGCATLGLAKDEARGQALIRYLPDGVVFDSRRAALMGSAHGAFLLSVCLETGVGGSTHQRQVSPHPSHSRCRPVGGSRPRLQRAMHAPRRAWRHRGTPPDGMLVASVLLRPQVCAPAVLASEGSGHTMDRHCGPGFKGRRILFWMNEKQDQSTAPARALPRDGCVDCGMCARLCKGVVVGTSTTRTCRGSCQPWRCSSEDCRRVCSSNA